MNKNNANWVTLPADFIVVFGRFSPTNIRERWALKNLLLFKYSLIYLCVIFLSRWENQIFLYHGHSPLLLLMGALSNILYEQHEYFMEYFLQWISSTDFQGAFRTSCSNLNRDIEITSTRFAHSGVGGTGSKVWTYLSISVFNTTQLFIPLVLFPIVIHC